MPSHVIKPSRWRDLSSDPKLVALAQREALTQLERLGPRRSRHEWWAFEGFSFIDCCLITPTCVLFIEGKRTDTVSPSTQWFLQRSQLWRNVEAAEQFAGPKQFGVILAVEEDADGRNALAVANSKLAPS